MATTKFKGQPVKVIGEFIKVGSVAPDFELVKTDLSSFSLKELNGKNVILNIFPSLDTGVCATQQTGYRPARYRGVGNLQGFAFCTCTFLYNGGY